MWVCMYMPVYACVYKYICTPCVSMCMHSFKSVCACMYTYRYVYMYDMWVCVYMDVNLYMYLHVHVYMCMYVYVWVCIYTGISLYVCISVYIYVCVVCVSLCIHGYKPLHRCPCVCMHVCARDACHGWQPERKRSHLGDTMSKEV